MNFLKNLSKPHLIKFSKGVDESYPIYVFDITAHFRSGYSFNITHKAYISNYSVNEFINDFHDAGSGFLIQPNSSSRHRIDELIKVDLKLVEELTDTKRTYNYAHRCSRCSTEDVFPRHKCNNEKTYEYFDLMVQLERVTR